jgi:hypothetical protein
LLCIMLRRCAGALPLQSPDRRHLVRRVRGARQILLLQAAAGCVGLISPSRLAWPRWWLHVLTGAGRRLRRCGRVHVGSFVTDAAGYSPAGAACPSVTCAVMPA